MNLNTKNFKSSIAPAEQVSFVKFFAPWCGHCKKMAPAWVDLAKDLGDDDSVMIAEVDCTVESSVCSDNGVKGYPTLKAFKGGKEMLSNSRPMTLHLKLDPGLGSSNSMHHGVDIARIWHQLGKLLVKIQKLARSQPRLPKSTVLNTT